jgi:3-deoxy-D-manno-octulosonic-acid transferase
VAARPILKRLREGAPSLDIVVSCTTSTGIEIASTLKPDLADHVIYFPIDIPWICRRAIRSVRPDGLAILETELWMNFLSAARSSGAQTLIVNGRISERSFRRSKWFAWFYRDLFTRVTSTLVQTNADAARFASLGARDPIVVGNSKYDDSEDGAATNDWRSDLIMGTDEHLIVVGSARGEIEEDLILSALRGTSARVVFAPRHLERAGEVVRKATSLGFDVGLRSSGGETAQLVILDTFGELAGLYDEADVAIVGGGFDRLGGQNIIQPMAAGCPVICGPNMSNFRDAFQQGVACGAVVVAPTSSDLRRVTEALLADPEARRIMGTAGRALVSANRGASGKYARAIASAAAVPWIDS